MGGGLDQRKKAPGSVRNASLNSRPPLGWKNGRPSMIGRLREPPRPAAEGGRHGQTPRGAALLGDHWNCSPAGAVWKRRRRGPWARERPGRRRQDRRRGEVVRTGAPLAPFLPASTGGAKHETGSGVGADGLPVASGPGPGTGLTDGRLCAGAFAGRGNGGRDACDSFAGVGGVPGGGDAERAGGGVPGRLEFNGTETGRLRMDFSAGAGRPGNDCESAGLLNPPGVRAARKAGTPRHGVRFGAGRGPGVGTSGVPGLRGRYFWSRASSEDVVPSSGDAAGFPAVDSRGAGAGARRSRGFNGHAAPRVGPALERGFDGAPAAARPRPRAAVPGDGRPRRRRRARPKSQGLPRGHPRARDRRPGARGQARGRRGRRHDQVRAPSPSKFSGGRL